MASPASIIRPWFAILCVVLLASSVQANQEPGDGDCECHCQAYSQLLEALDLDLPDALRTVDQCGHRCAIKWASCEVTDLDQAEHSDSDDQPSSLEKDLATSQLPPKQSVGAVRRTAAQ